MADPTVPKKHWWSRLFEQISLDAAIAVAAQTCWSFVKEKLFKFGADATTQKLQAIADKDKYVADQRKRLLKDFRILETQENFPIPNLKRRRREAVKDLSENRFIRLLCELEDDPTTGRREDLKWLEGMSDEEFEESLYSLDHDSATQHIEKASRTIGRNSKKWGRKLKKLFSFYSEKAGERWGRTKAWIRDHVGIFGSCFEGFFDWCGRLLEHSFLFLGVVAILIPLALLVGCTIAFLIFAFSRTGRIVIATVIGVVFLVLNLTGAWLDMVPTFHGAQAIALVIGGILAAVIMPWRRDLTWLRWICIAFFFTYAAISFFGGIPAIVEMVHAAEERYTMNQEIDRMQEVQKEDHRHAEVLAEQAKRPAPQAVTQAAPVVHDVTIAGIVAGLNAAQKQTVVEAQTIAPPTTPPATSMLVTTPMLPPTPVKPCRTANDDSAPTFQYGELKIIIAECHREGTQETFAGRIEYTGPERKLLAFHRFFPSDAAGNKYAVQEGRIGRFSKFGMGPDYQWMEVGKLAPNGRLSPDVVDFSFVIGSIDPSSSAPMNLALPWNQSEEGVNFRELIEAK